MKSKHELIEKFFEMISGASNWVQRGIEMMELKNDVLTLKFKCATAPMHMT